MNWFSPRSLAHTARQGLNRALIRMGFPQDWFLIPLAAIIGSAAGAVAQGYGQLVHYSENVFFQGVSRLQGWWWALLMPAVGGLLVGLIKTMFRLPMTSHGIPEVIEAMARRQGRLPLKTGIFTALNSSITLGCGGSTGQEGPIVHIGSVVGSVMGRLLRVSRQHLNTLVGCGAAAGLAAIFNAPMAGVLLVLEVVLREFSPKTFMPLVIASVFGVAANEALAEDYGAALFTLPPGQFSFHFTYQEALPYLFLGIACGLGGWSFGKALVFTEKKWEGFKIPKFVKPAIGGLLLGVLGVVLVSLYPGVIPNYQPPAFFGNGYPVIQHLLLTKSYEQPSPLPPAATLTIGFLLLVGLGKTVGTGLTLGSGGSGGIFAPTLFIGAAFGAAFGKAVELTGHFTTISPAAYALAGMAGVLSAVVHCPLTAIILVFEITGVYKVILPVMLVTIIATVISQVLNRDSVYILALKERGVHVNTLPDLALLRSYKVRHVPPTPHLVVRPEDPVQKLIELAATYTGWDYVVCDDNGKYLGMVVGDDLRTALLQREAVPLMIVAELMRSDLPVVRPEDTLDTVLDKFAAHDVSSLTVVDPANRAQSLITRAKLIRQYHDALGSR